MQPYVASLPPVSWDAAGRLSIEIMAGVIILSALLAYLNRPHPPSSTTGR